MILMSVERNFIKTMDYSGLKTEKFELIRKSISRGTEWHKFQLQSTFQ